MKTILAGGQYGDEGKGKISSYIAVKDNPEVVARAGVGPNAGHRVLYKGRWYGLRMLPSGFVNESSKVLVGTGVMINPAVFLEEMEQTNTKGRIFVDKGAGIILQKHIEEDSTSETSKKIGTTKTGCGPSLVDRVRRTAKRADEIEELKPYLTDGVKMINEAKNVFIEGSQGFMLSLYYGTYPFVTSKDVTASSFAADVGIGPTKIDEVILVIKSYTTRVGNGPFPSEIGVEEAEELSFQEYGTVTKRPRRTSKELHFDDLKKAVMVNGATQIAITKIDIRFKGNEGVTEYEKLTQEAKDYVNIVEKKLDVPVTLIGTGPDTEHIVDRREEIL